jgi:hypothetical protein
MELMYPVDRLRGNKGGRALGDIAVGNGYRNAPPLADFLDVLRVPSPFAEPMREVPYAVARFGYAA